MDKKRDPFFLSDNKSWKGKDLKEKPNRPDRSAKKISEDSDNAKDKKPFDKKTYRLKKYSKKYKLEQWEEQRKKKLLRNYYKDISKEDNSGTFKSKGFDEPSVDESDAPGKFVRHPDLIEMQNKKINQNVPKLGQKHEPFRKAKEQYNKIKEEKNIKKLEVQNAKEQRRQKLLEYKKKKAEKFKKLSRKNKKGQPVMTGRLELLLEKIQQQK